MPVPTIAFPDLAAPPEINPSIAGRPGMTLAQSGEQISELGDLTTEVAERVRKAQETLALTSAGNDITAAFDKYQQALATSGDPDHMPDAQAWTDALRKQFAQNPKYVDPRVQRAIGLNIDSVGLEAQKQTFARKLTLQKQDMDAQLSVLHQNAAFQAAEAWNDPAGYQKALDSFEIPAHAAEASGFITAKDHEIQSQSLKASAEDVHLVNAINRENPDLMQTVLDDADAHPERYQDLQPQRFAELKKYLRTAIDTARERTDKVDVAKQGDILLQKLRNDATLKDVETKDFNPLQAAQKVDADPDVPTNVKKYVRTELEEEAGVQQKLENDNDMKMLNDLDPMVESGQLTFRELTRRENLPPQSPGWIPRRVADPLLTKAAQIQRENRITNMQEKGLARQERIDKSADLRDELLSQSGYIVDQSELTPYRLKGLSAADANIVWKVRGINSDPAWGLAVKTIQASPAFNIQTTQGKADMSKFLIGFAHTVEKQQLTGQQITDELTKELQAPEKTASESTVSKWWDWLAAAATPTAKPSTETETPKQPARPANVPDDAQWNPNANDGRGAWQVQRQ